MCATKHTIANSLKGALRKVLEKVSDKTSLGKFVILLFLMLVVGANGNHIEMY